MGVKFSQLPIASSVSSDDYLAVLDTAERTLKRTTINHASTTDAFGLSTATAYGHSKIIDDLSKSTFADGEALSAHQGNVLANDLGYVESNNIAGHTHAVGEYFMFKGQFVKCTAVISVGNTITVGTNVAVTDVGSVLSQLNSNLAPIYSAQKTYAVGDLCTHSGKLYKCIVAVTTPEAFSISKWDDVTASEVFEPKRTLLKTVTSDGVHSISELLTTLLSNINPYSDGINNYSVTTKDSNEVREFTLSTAGSDGEIRFVSHFGFYSGSGYSDLASVIGVRFVNNVLTGYQFAFRANYTSTGTVTPTHVLNDYSSNVNATGSTTYYLYK